MNEIDETMVNKKKKRWKLPIAGDIATRHLLISNSNNDKR